LVAIVVGVVHLIHPIWYQPELFPTLVAIGWASFNLALVTSGVLLLRKVSRRATYRFPTSTDSYWQVWGDNAWHPSRSVDFSATGIGLENTGPSLRLGDQVKLIIPNKPDVGEMPNAKKQGLIPFSKQAIVLNAIVTSEYNGKHNGKQRIGLLIQKFASYSDMANYFGIVYSPSRLLNGDKAKYQQLVPANNK
jgi:hypothetical protein